MENGKRPTAECISTAREILEIFRNGSDFALVFLCKPWKKQGKDFYLCKVNNEDQIEVKCRVDGFTPFHDLTKSNVSRMKRILKKQG